MWTVGLVDVGQESCIAVVVVAAESGQYDVEWGKRSSKTGLVMVWAKLAVVVAVFAVQSKELMV